MNSFTPRLATLPLPQQRVWPELRTVPPNFVLYGGTALALRLGHRQSVDFDFFSAQPFEPDELFRKLPFLTGGTRLQSSRNTLMVEVDREGPVQLSFFGGLSLGRVGVPDTAAPGGIAVASLLDLAGTKMAVIQERAMSKDYLDVDALLKAGLEVPAMLAAATALYGEQFNPMISLKALSYFQDGDLPELSQETRQRLSAASMGTREIPKIGRMSDQIAP